jgi:hypothetical protein
MPFVKFVLLETYTASASVNYKAVPTLFFLQVGYIREHGSTVRVKNAFLLASNLATIRSTPTFYLAAQPHTAPPKSSSELHTSHIHVSPYLYPDLWQRR